MKLFPVAVLAAISIATATVIGVADYLPSEPYKPTKVAEKLTTAMEGTEFRVGAPVFIRIFKQSNRLEVWQQRPRGTYALFRTYPICYYSGSLGPKLKEGDKQSPEGFYRVTRSALNPNSRFHLSFNLGFPNRFDRSHKRTGSYLMVHGNCVSIGCYAMTNKGIEEIYTLVAAALKNGQRQVDVHIFPFEMTEGNLALHADSKWTGFWQNLRTGYDLFEKTRQVPKVSVSNKAYVFALAN